jgi:hypothetical protein
MLSFLLFTTEKREMMRGDEKQENENNKTRNNPKSGNLQSPELITL